MTCYAYTDAGRICGQPAVAFDVRRGCAVCAQHDPMARGLAKESISNASPDWPLAMAQLAMEETHGQTEAQEGSGQEGRQEVSPGPVRVLTWRDVYRDGRLAYYELVVSRSPRASDFNVNVSLEPRPAYCDRGRWIAQAMGVPDLDGADAFPRYYMDLDRAKAELHDWLLWRLCCEEHG